MCCSWTGICQIWEIRLEIWLELDLAGFRKNLPDSGFATAIIQYNPNCDIHWTDTQTAETSLSKSLEWLDGSTQYVWLISLITKQASGRLDLRA